MGFGIGFTGLPALLGQLRVFLEAVIFIFLFFMLARRLASLKKPFIVFSMLVQVAYIVWRVAFTIPLGNPAGIVFGVLLVGAEALGAFQAVTHRLLYMREPRRDRPFMPQLDRLPTVDVLICIYNEPIKVIEKTVAAAVSLSYPRDRLRIFVCDDGRREEVRRIAHRFGAAWVTRPDNKFAKAGNINNCLRTVARGEYFLILDADVVVRSSFLERTIGYFGHRRVAFVQAPQVFYTPDPFQYNLPFKDRIPNEQDYFMREIQPRRAAWGATLFVGSNGVFRRSCIDEIGLIPTESITEDIATSLLLEAHGYIGVTVDEVLAVGLSAESFADYVSQHERWGRGNIQVLKKYKPLTRKGLTFMQRLLYLDGIAYWFFGLQKVIYILCPIFFLFTAIPIFYSDLFTMVMMFLPAFLLSVLVFRLFSPVNRKYGWAHIYETAMAPYMALSALLELLFSFRLKFKVTPKGQSRDKSTFSFRVALPHIILAAASLGALGCGVDSMLHGSVWMVPVYLLNFGWLLYNLWGLVLNILICIEKPRLRSSERLSVRASVMVHAVGGVVYPASVVDMSEGGCGVVADVDARAFRAIGQRIGVILERGSRPVTGTVVRRDPSHRFLAVKFDDLDADRFVQVIRFIFDRQETGYGSFQKKKKAGGPPVDRAAWSKKRTAALSFDAAAIIEQGQVGDRYG